MVVTLGIFCVLVTRLRAAATNRSLYSSSERHRIDDIFGTRFVQVCKVYTDSSLPVLLAHDNDIG